MLYCHRHHLRYRMRRAFVIFLILLFPLNVLALSWSVATQPAAAVQAEGFPVADSDSFFARLFAADTTLDIDPDEPPPMDLHDIVNHEAALQFTTLPVRMVCRHDARRHCLSIPPPVRPPRLA